MYAFALLQLKANRINELRLLDYERGHGHSCSPPPHPFRAATVATMHFLMSISRLLSSVSSVSSVLISDGHGNLILVGLTVVTVT